jgi:hypothetical protein
LEFIRRAFGRGSQAVPWNSEESIREELFSIERLEQHAESLAAAQDVAAGSIAGRSLAVRLRENESVLLQAYRGISGMQELVRELCDARRVEGRRVKELLRIGIPR